MQLRKQRLRRFKEEIPGQLHNKTIVSKFVHQFYV